MNVPIVPLNARIPIQSRIICIASPGSFPTLPDYPERILTKIVNKGEAFFFKTKADGSYDIEVFVSENQKLIEGLEMHDELIDHTNGAVIKLTENVEIGDIKLWGNPNNLSFKVLPGSYLVRIFFIANDVEFYGFKIVLSPTTREAVNDLLMIDSLK